MVEEVQDVCLRRSTWKKNKFYLCVTVFYIITAISRFKITFLQKFILTINAELLRIP